MTKETAIKILKELHDNSLFSNRIALETLIPELADSNAEKIRKALVDALNKNLGNGIEKYGTTLNAALTWLEKQGSQQPTIIWHSVSEEPEEMKELFCEWESDDATWHDVAFYDEESKTFRHAKMPINVTKWVYVDELLEKQGEQKPFDYESVNIQQKDFAPEQEPKKIEDEIEIPFGAKDSELQEVTYYIPKGFHAEIDDDKVVIKKDEKSAAWSKEDEKMYKIALSCIETLEDISNGKNMHTDVKDWLKSLKDRIGG